MSVLREECGKKVVALSRRLKDSNYFDEQIVREIWEIQLRFIQKEQSSIF